jgi:hypothetical protein
MPSPEEDLEYSVRVYGEEQVREHAEACRAGRCRSYLHCFFGKPREDMTPPDPVCACRILEAMEAES